MRNKLIPLTLAFSTTPFAFYKMEEFKRESNLKPDPVVEYQLSANRIFTLFKIPTKEQSQYLYPQNCCYYNNNINYVFLLDFFSSNDPRNFSFSSIKECPLIQQPFLMKDTINVRNDDIQKREFFMNLLIRENSNNLSYCMNKDENVLTSRIYLSKTETFTDLSEVVVNNEKGENASPLKTSTEKVTLRKGDDFVDLQEALIDYYKNEKDDFNIKMSQSITNEAADDLAQVGSDIRNNNEVLDCLRDYKINGLFAVIKDESDTVLFGTAKSNQKNIFWITKIRGDLSTLFNLKSS